MKVSNSYIGRPMERVEDLRMVRGRGTYVADVNRPNQLYAVILRSSVAHGRWRSGCTIRRDVNAAIVVERDRGKRLPIQSSRQA